MSTNHESIQVKAGDGVEVHARLHRTGEGPGGQRLTVLSPGFAQREDTRTMGFIAEGTAFLGDRLVLDYRGNGASSGRFTFGAEEHRDLRAILMWAGERYDEVGVVGFSLGAYTALRTVREWGEGPACPVDRLWLVSVPTCLEEIVWSGGAFLNPLALPFRLRRKKAIRPQNDLLFRWGWPFHGKPDLAVEETRLPCATHFLCGGEDTLVFPSLSRRVYEATGDSKTWAEISHAHHAERIAVECPDEFFGWLRDTAGQASVA